MIADLAVHEAPTRRDTVRYGGAVVAGCAGQSGPQSTPAQTNTGSWR